MRIISGKAKGTRLASLGKAELRPTLDRVRESVFNILSPRIQGSFWLDLFAGTGAVSLEAVSRGATLAMLVEPGKAALEIISKNLARCKFKDQSVQVFRLEALQALKKLEAGKVQFDFVYIDPPFNEKHYDPILSTVGEGSLLKTDSWILVEHFHKEELADCYGKLNRFDQRRMGDTTVSFYAFE
ncbi:MAG: 16S rRNA (guanine(966)-N(2))-methyltransferase RsmD [Candidatus Nitronauta litoralis]|uniref:16S rRNA (Guanine(966)-N(2))-methyltransferase RsmD n=1 Tax=Candidatus Nitronauta litoralis TaxID=2705533 RepID=A0A7T0G1H3_9BACT|nr:MAG: 16S rRNA (guanine(966)-N(2))-methyltransferase RsmD [Candidatus Nitronauta litoralis]